MDSNISHIEDKEGTFCEPDEKEGNGDNVVKEPKVGMIFSSEEEV